ncbi:MAG: hypothetical protein ACRD2W_21885 [Acidimicrobiales bacterium]
MNGSEGWRAALPTVVAAALLCWAVPAGGFLEAASDLRACPDECTRHAFSPIAYAALLWPFAIGLAVVARVAWNRSGRDIEAPRLLLALLAAGALMVAVFVVTGSVQALGADPEGGNPSRWHEAVGVAALTLLLAVMVALAVAVYRWGVMARRR